ncbi:Beta-glucan synthesis-associated [Mycena venus]|uniref:Beta-glucan synthesis-associated n=1 Tax=Mycena venus TaxID=2733690 RepID=A0A8H6ZAI8_9AGAR|nr:Beta-glucan synthesis-associated [Mycena venus]
MKAGAIGPDTASEIGARLIPEEPMVRAILCVDWERANRLPARTVLDSESLDGFQHQDFEHMAFPNKMYVDYIRVYQRDGVSEGVTCNLSKHPTSDCINKCVLAHFLYLGEMGCHGPRGKTRTYDFHLALAGARP